MKHRFGLVVVLACAVGLVVVYPDGSADLSSAGDDSQTRWLCKSCSHSFLLTARQVAQRADPDPQRWAPLVCAKCRQKQAYLAMVCPTCQTIYFGRDVPGESGKCPKCAPSPRLVVVENDRHPAGDTSQEVDAKTRAKPTAKLR